MPRVFCAQKSEQSCRKAVSFAGNTAQALVRCSQTAQRDQAASGGSVDQALKVGAAMRRPLAFAPRVFFGWKILCWEMHITATPTERPALPPATNLPSQVVEPEEEVCSPLFLSSPAARARRFGELRLFRKEEKENAVLARERAIFPASPRRRGNAHILNPLSASHSHVTPCARSSHRALRRRLPRRQTRPAQRDG